MASTKKDLYDWVPMALQLIFGVGGNTIALVLLIKSSRQHGWHSFYRLFTGLVISDLSIGVLAAPVTIAKSINFSLNFTPSVCSYDSFVLMFGLWSSAIVIGALTIDRLLVMYSTSIPQNLNGRKCCGALFICWTIAGIYSFVHLPFHKTRLSMSKTCCYMYTDDVKITSDNTEMTLAYFFSIFGLTYVSANTVLNVWMFHIVTASPQFRARLTDAERIPSGYDFHSNIFLAAVAILFSALWIPHLVGIDILNPWIYVLFRKEDIVLYKSWIGWCRHRRNNIKGEITPLLTDDEHF